MLNILGRVGRRRPQFHGPILPGLEAAVIAAMLILVNVLAPGGSAAGLPSMFADSFVASVNAPTDITFTPGGRAIVSSQNGTLYILSGSTASPILDLSGVICDDFERGLLGVTLDPSFSSNRFVYVYYTFAKSGNCGHNSSTAPVNRVSRFLMPSGGVTLDPSSEFVVVDNIPSPNGNHNGGDLAFGNDGLLYISAGDGGCALTDSSKCAGQNTNARRRDILSGKILRVAGDGSIPSGNPYTSATTSVRCSSISQFGNGKNCRETFAWGLRNPFRIAMDPNAGSTKFYINDVGQDVYEEIDLGANNADYGWNCREGFHAGPAPSSGCPASSPTSPVAEYDHGSTGCASITGGAFVPNGVWPATYSGTYFYADYVCGKIFALKGGATTTFANSLSGPTTLQFGPSLAGTSLYYLAYNTGQVRRISYTGLPVASATATPNFGALPLLVNFNGSASTNPAGGALTYDWDFGDGSAHNTSGPVVSHTYTTLPGGGFRTATLTVKNAGNAAASTTLKIFAGNAGPVPLISSPSPSLIFAVGDAITLQGSAQDANGTPITGNGLTWEVLLHHDTHTHPFLLSTHTNPKTITAPQPENLLAAGNSYLEIRFTATDSNGLSTTVSQNVLPKKVNLKIQTDPAGGDLLIEGERRSSPVTFVTWAKNPIDIEALDGVSPGGEALRFASWSDGGAQAHTIVAPAINATYTANLDVLDAPTFEPVADARVRQSEPRSNYATSNLVVRGGSSKYNSLLRFDVQGISGPVTSAKLYLYGADGTSDGPNVFKTSSNWSETALTWNNQPGPSGNQLDDAGPVADDTWFILDVSDAINGNGQVSFLLTGDSGNSITMPARESSTHRPRLIVEGNTTGDGADPSTPVDLSATALTSGMVEVNWSASTDNVGVVAYDVFRNGVLLTTIGAAPQFTDTTNRSNTTYSYSVRARDAAGGLSDLSDQADVTTPSATSNTILTPIADAFVYASNPTSSYGFRTYLRTQGGSAGIMESFLKFHLPPVSGSFYRLTLRVFVPAGTSNGSTDGPAVYVVSPQGWSEAVTWSTHPSHSNSSFADSGLVVPGTWVSFDLTDAAIQGNTDRAFALVSDVSDYAVFSSREGATPPQLILAVNPDGAGINAASASSPEATPMPSPTPTAAAAFPVSDGFESGDLAIWTEATGVQVVADATARGAFVAEAASRGTSETPGEPANALLPFPEPRSDIYARAFVNVAGSSGEADLLALTDRTGKPLVTLAASSEMHLLLRSDRTGTSLDLGPLPPDSWHEVELHLVAAGSQSTVQVWLDGALIHDDAIRIANRPVMGLRIGDSHTDRTFDLRFDEIAIDTTCVGTCPAELHRWSPAPTATPGSSEPTPTQQPVEATATGVAPTPEPTEQAEPTATASPEPTLEPTEETSPTGTAEPTETPTDESTT